MRPLGQRADIGHLEQGIGHGFDQKRGRSVGLNGKRYFVEIGDIDKMHRDALLGEERRQQAVGRAVAVGRGDHVPAGTYACSEQRGMDRRHARCHGKGRLAVFKRCHCAFERIDRRAFVTAVDITVFLAGKDRFHGGG